MTKKEEQLIKEFYKEKETLLKNYAFIFIALLGLNLFSFILLFRLLNFK